MNACQDCRIDYERGDDGVQRYFIRFCHLHAATEEMSLLLQEFLDNSYHTDLVSSPHGGLWCRGCATLSSWEYGMIHKPTCIHARTQQILAAANPQEPADDSEMPLGPIKAPARGLE